MTESKPLLDVSWGRNRDEASVHVAGVIDMAEAELLIDSGVRRLGFPLVLGYHDEDLGIDDAAHIVARLGRRADFFLITYLADADSVLSLCRSLGVSIVQLHGEFSNSELVRLRQESPSLRIIKSVIVGREKPAQQVEAVRRLAPLVDAFITDTFDPETGATGATGRTHDWRMSRRLVEQSPKPVILAGGLTPANVREAIRAVRPAGVDVHTGIEGADGRKRRDLTDAFMAEAMAGYSAIRPNS